MANPDRVLKSTDITLLTKVHRVKALVFPVVMYGCESWTIKKAECWGIDAFELWCWRRLLRVPWSAKRSNQSILKEISPDINWKDWCWSWNSNTLATWCEELTHWKRPWCWERFTAGGEGDDRGWDGWMASPIQWTLVWAHSGRWWRTGRLDVPQFMGSQRVWLDWATEQQPKLAANPFYSHKNVDCKWTCENMHVETKLYSVLVKRESSSVPLLALLSISTVKMLDTT